MKQLIAGITLALAAAAGGFSAAASQPNVLCINRTDGAQDRLILSEKLDVKTSDEGNILLIHPEITVEYSIEEVRNFTFEEVENPEVYEGDHQLAIEAPEIAGHDISVSDDGVRISGADTAVLYDIQGRELMRRKSTSGESILIETLSLPKGVYILRAGNTSLKIKI